MDDARPILIQLDISHYSEKIRRALDYKRVPHVRLLPFHELTNERVVL